MPTLITSSNTSDCLSGSMEKRLDIAPDGALWALVVLASSPGQAKFFVSRDGGASWTYSAGSDIEFGWNFIGGPSSSPTSAVTSFFIDTDGRAHVSWVKWASDPQIIVNALGAPTGSGGWVWGYIPIQPAGGRLGAESDVIAHRNGTGWTTWVAWNYGTGTGGAKVSRIDTTSTGSRTLTSTEHGPSTGAAANQFGTLEWAHNGDGKTRSGDPHLFYTTAVRGTAGPLRVQRAAHSAGTWTWETPVVVAASAQVEQSALCSVWDGARLMVAYSPGDNTISVAEWDGVASGVTFRNPPSLPGGTGVVLGLSLAHDPATDDIYLVFHDDSDGDVFWSKFNRATTSWGAWASAVGRTATSFKGKVQLLRHPPRDSVDMLWASGTGTSWAVFSQQLVALVRAPAAPTLISPNSGALADLASGGSFEWTYNAVAPGDLQQAYAFRRIEGSTTEYWNSTTQAWSGGVVWNASTPTNPTRVTFPAGAWDNGTTYAWSVATRSATGADGPFATDRTVVATTAPVVVVTAPVGVVLGESTPLVEWTYTSLEAQANYQVRIIEEQVGIDPDVTTPVWDSGVITSALARSLRVGTSLEDGGAYRAYVKETSASTATSAWSYTSFTVSVTPPNGPVVEVLDEIHWDTGVPRIRLDVTARTNFLTLDQDMGGAGWDVGTNCTVEAQAEDTVNQISAGLKVTSLAAGLMNIITELGDPPEAPYGEVQPAGPLSFPVIPGVTYTGLASFRAEDSASRAARVKINWYDADDGTGDLISTSTGEMQTVTDVGYVQASVTDIAPTGAALARLVLEVVNPAATGEEFYIAHPDFHPGASTEYGPGGYSTIQAVRVERSIDGGTTWQAVVDRIKTSRAQRATAQDRAAPFGVEVKYRAFTDVDLTGSTLTSNASLVSTFMLESDAWAIRDPNDEDAEFLAYVVDHDRSDDEASSVHWPAGREYPIVDTEGPQAATGTLKVFVYANQIDAVTAILRSTTPMLVQTPLGKVYNVRLIRRHYNIEQVRHRIIEISYVEVAP